MAKVRKRIWTTKTGERIAWVADYFAPGPDGEKRRCTKTFPTKKEANAWLAHTVVEIKQAVHTPAHRSPAIAVAGEAWIRQAETDGLERSTVVCYRQHVDLHIKPFLGHHKLCDLICAWAALHRLSDWRPALDRVRSFAVGRRFCEAINGLTYWLRSHADLNEAPRLARCYRAAQRVMPL